MKICLVTADIIGPIKNGGIGTAFFHLAHLLATEGHDVTILYALGEYTESEPISHWQEYYKAKNIQFVPLPKPSHPVFGGEHLSRSYAVYEWLKTQSFDMIHSHEWQGLLFYALEAKQAGIAFLNTEIIVQLHSPTLWHLIHNGQAISNAHWVQIDYMERSSAAKADRVIAPSRYMLEWCESQGWQLPVNQMVLPNLSEPDAPHEHNRALDTITEIVFFGRLEPRKGLDIFIKALASLAPQLLAKNIALTFMGKQATLNGVDAESYIRQALAKTNLNINILTHYSSNEALEYLSRNGMVAVIPSLAENSPYTVLECLRRNITLLASNVGGIPELILPDDHATHLFTPIPSSLAALLQHTIDYGLAPARPAISSPDVTQHWLNLHKQSYTAPANPTPSSPLVSVCITHYNRPDLLELAVDSIRNQDYANYEIIVVDDGSTDDDALEYLARLENESKSRVTLTVLRQQNRYLGAARNNAASNAKGEYLLFMDDDNIAMSHELSHLVHAASRCGADIITAAMIRFEGSPSNTETHQIFSPLGGAIAAGTVENIYGDANALIKREVFLALGGFSEDYGLGLEDYEFFAKAALAGHNIATYPDPVFFYRVASTSMIHATNQAANGNRAIRPYAAQFPAIAPALYLLRGYHFALSQVSHDITALKESNSALQSGFNELQAACAELKTSRSELIEHTNHQASIIDGVTKPLAFNIIELRDHRANRRYIKWLIRLLKIIYRLIRPVPLR